MPEAFKNQLNTTLIAHMAEHLHRVAGGEFDRALFEAAASAGLDELELKQRVRHISLALHRSLPSDFERAVTLIESALMPVPDSPRPWELQQVADGISGWAVWPLTDYVASHGLAHPQRSLQALHALTQRFTSEFALRPFLQRWPDLTLHTLQQWVEDDSEHVRRLVSEGTRPRLPWGIRLPAFIADPAPCLPLLDRLYRDPSEYVRRSVANHLNDISKDHPQRAVAIAEGWLQHGNADTPALVRHGLRTLVKQGEPGALRLLGFSGEQHITLLNMQLQAPRVAVGDSLGFSFELHHGGDREVQLSVDYAVWHVRANGSLSPKVFKLARPRLAPGGHVRLQRQHSLRPVTTRRYYPGRHALEILVNGERHAWAEFELLPG